jgi:hypothetical protein
LPSGTAVAICVILYNISLGVASQA